MRMSRVCFNIGAWPFIVVGVAHIGFSVSRMLSSTRPAIIDAMREYMTPRGVDLLSLYDGYSLTMGVLLIAAGSLNLFFSKLDTDFPERSKSVIAFNIGLSLIVTLLSFKFFFAAPTVLFLISLIAYIVAIALPNKALKTDAPK
jgi:hypothetical protein